MERKQKKRNYHIPIINKNTINTATHYLKATKMSQKNKTMSHSSKTKPVGSVGQRLVGGSDSPGGV